MTWLNVTYTSGDRIREDKVLMELDVDGNEIHSENQGGDEPNQPVSTRMSRTSQKAREPVRFGGGQLTREVQGLMEVEPFRRK